MRTCPKCGQGMMRAHRTRLQKVLYSDAFCCSNCPYRDVWLRPTIDVNLSFFFSRFTRCVRCGTDKIHSLRERDQLDSMSKHPTSLLFALTGAPIRKCPYCRLQYHDWRPPAPTVRRNKPLTAKSGD